MDVLIRPKEYHEAFAGPLKGFRPDLPLEEARPPGRWDKRYVTLVRQYIRWNQIERNAEDGADLIRRFCDERWGQLPARNIKVIPRVFLHWPPNGNFWPEDLEAGDYSSVRFLDRLAGMIHKLGQAWDDDPRVAYVETGMIGPCGEQWNPSPSPELTKVMGDAYVSAFKCKLLMNRYPWQFQDYPFGTFWDSWGTHKDTAAMVAELESPRLAGRWKTAVRGGEISYNFGQPPGEDPNDTMTDDGHVAWVECVIRRLHWNHLGWVSRYDPSLPKAAANAARLQKVFGHRFVIDEVRYPASVAPGGGFDVSFAVRNVGSGPFYYNWPVELSLLDETKRTPLWRATFEGVDIRRWLSGDRWLRWGSWDQGLKRFVVDDAPERYADPPPRYEVRGVFKAPCDLSKGRYVLALAILDPGGASPSCRFAIANYFTGGRHPIGRIGLGAAVGQAELDHRDFDDLAADGSLRYQA